MLLVLHFLKDFLNFTGSFCYFDGEEGNNIQNWKYEHVVYVLLH